MIEANPRLENGYTQIANEILEALARMNLSPYEGRALFFLIRKTYGWRKKTDWISLSQFSKGLCLDRSNVFRALKGLKRKKLIVVNRDNKKRPTYGFQKDYSRWDMPDCNKNDLAARRLPKEKGREREERKSVCTDNIVLSLLTPTKETLTKETVKERRERDGNISSKRKSPKTVCVDSVTLIVPDAFDGWPVFYQNQWLQKNCRMAKVKKGL